MLEKINFKNGVILSSALLNEVQKATVINPRFPRDNYYGAPTTFDENIWYIGERDSIKDWEFPDPSLEPQSAMGKLAYDGVVLGCRNCDLGIEEFVELQYGPPRITYRDLLSEPLPSSSDENPSLGVFVNAGSYLNSQGQKVSWGTTAVIVDIGTNYIYYDITNDLVAANGVLPNKTRPHIPLAMVEVAPLLLQDENDEPIADPESFRVSYTDLRPGLFIHSDRTIELQNYDTIITDDFDLESWWRVFADTSNGGFNITLPSAPIDGDRVAIFDVSGSFDTYPVRVYAEGDQTILRDHQTWDLETRFSHTEFLYYEPLEMWIIVGHDVGLGSKEPLGEFVSCGGTECVGTLEAEDCPNGVTIPAVFPNPSEGTYEYADGKCYKNLNETIAVYSDGEGGFIKVFNAPRCRKELVDPMPYGEDSKTIYVDGALGNDTLRNSGLSPDAPFRTIERALIEAGSGTQKYTIKLAAGDYYVDNRPGTDSVFQASKLSGYHNLVESGFSVFSYNPESKVLVISGDDQECSDQPPGIELGRVIYTLGGSYGTIVYAERDRECYGECGWRFRLEGVKGQFNAREDLYYNNLSHFNSKAGGVIIPRGTSIVGSDLRKTTIRPIFVPSIAQRQAFLNSKPNSESSVFKLSSDCYISGVSFGDNGAIKRYHNTLSVFSFVSQEEVLDQFESSDTRGYYYKLAVFQDDLDIAQRNRRSNDSEIVSNAPFDRNLRFQDQIENQTRGLYSDKDGHPTLIRNPGDLSSLGINIPDINSVYGGSPYIRNCSVKSIFGLSGLHADGSLVSGFKSVIADSFTVVSLQVDPEAYEDGVVKYFNDPAALTGPKKYKENSIYRHYGYKASNEGFIQGSSAFVIGCADHFYTYDGGEISLVSSSSNFGDISLKSEGFFPRAFTQDYSIKTESSKGTRITELIPPKPIEDHLTSKRVNIGYKFLLDPSKLYYESQSNPATYRLYIESIDQLNPLSATNPPDSRYLRGYSFTRRNSLGTVEFSGNNITRDSFYLNGLDGKTYGGRPVLVNDPALRDDSQVFQFDPEPPVRLTALGGFQRQGNRLIVFPVALPQLRTNSYIRINSVVYQVESVFLGDSTTTVTTTTQLQFTESTGLTAFLSSNDVTGGRWFIEVQNVGINSPVADAFFSDALASQTIRLPNNGSIYTVRDVDTRALDERIYRVKLEGYFTNLGLRSPQEGYIVAKQYDLDPDYLDLDKSNPLVLARVEPTELDGVYTASLVYGEDLPKAYDGGFYPISDPDRPEQLLGGSDPTRKAIWGYEDVRGFKDLGLAIKQDGDIVTEPIASEEPYKVYSIIESRTDFDLRIQLHRPSTIRTNSHMWEWVGYLSYDTSLPKFQGPEFTPEAKLKKLFLERSGGRIFASGMDETGTFYVNNKPLSATLGAQSNAAETNISDIDLAPQNNLVINNQLVMNPGSDLVLSEDTTLVLEGSTRLLAANGNPITVANPVAGVMASETIAGLTQLANELEVRTGTVDNKVVTPKTLASLTATTERRGLIGIAATLDSNNYTLAVTPGRLLGLNATATQKGLVILTDGDGLGQGNRVVTSATLEAALEGYAPSGSTPSSAIVNLGSGSSINVSLGKYFTRTVNGNVSLSLTGASPSSFYEVTLRLRHLTGTITFPASVLWPGGVTPTFTIGRSHVIKLVTDDGGATWFGSANTNYLTEV